MRILLSRTKGHGDILSLTSAIPGLQKKHPGVKVYFKTIRGYDQLIRHDPRIAGIRWFFFDRPSSPSFDTTINVAHGAIWPAADKEEHLWMGGAQCRKVGVEFSPAKMYLLPEELETATGCDVAIANKYPLGARSYEHMTELASQLAAEKYHVMQIDDCHPRPYNRGIDCPELTIREAAAEIAKARCLVTVDSVFLHVGAALGRPMVVIFNPARSSPRSQYVPGSWVADWHQKPREITLMVKHLLGDGPAPDEENTFDPAYKESQL